MTPHVERAIDRYFRGAIREREERDALFGHLDRCDACRAAFDAQAAAHRALAKEQGGVPPTELALILPAVLDGIAPPEPRRSWAWLVALAPIAALLLAVIALRGRGPDDGYASKGGTPIPLPVIEALCFDEKAAVSAHLKATGTCPAPGFVKLVYGSTDRAPYLTVLVLAEKEVRLFESIERPTRETVIGDYAKLAPGETLRVIAVWGERPLELEAARARQPIMSIHGAAP
jgi:hypothetical protein